MPTRVRALPPPPLCAIVSKVWLLLVACAIAIARACRFGAVTGWFVNIVGGRGLCAPPPVESSRLHIPGHVLYRLLGRACAGNGHPGGGSIPARTAPPRFRVPRLADAYAHAPPTNSFGDWEWWECPAWACSMIAAWRHPLSSCHRVTPHRSAPWLGKHAVPCSLSWREALWVRPRGALSSVEANLVGGRPVCDLTRN